VTLEHWRRIFVRASKVSRPPFTQILIAMARECQKIMDEEDKRTMGYDEEIEGGDKHATRGCIEGR
jgi:hypothetical protein